MVLESLLPSSWVKKLELEAQALLGSSWKILTTFLLLLFVSGEFFDRLLRLWGVSHLESLDSFSIYLSIFNHAFGFIEKAFAGSSSLWEICWGWSLSRSWQKELGVLLFYISLLLIMIIRYNKSSSYYSYYCYYYYYFIFYELKKEDPTAIKEIRLKTYPL